MGDHGVLEQYLGPYSDSSSSDATTISDIDKDPQLSENAPLTSQYQSRSSRKSPLASSDSDDSPCSPSSSSSGSTKSFEEFDIRDLLHEEGARVIDIISRKIEVREKGLLKEILSLGISVLDLQRPSIHRLVADKCDDYVSGVRDDIISTVSHTPLSSPDKRHLADALLLSLEAVLTDILETIKKHLIKEKRQSFKADPELYRRLYLQKHLEVGQQGGRLASLEPPVVESPVLIKELDGHETTKKRFWNHITISRDQTSASNFVNEVLLSVLRKGNCLRTTDNLDWDEGRQNSLIKPPTVSITPRVPPGFAPGGRPPGTPNPPAQLRELHATGFSSTGFLNPHRTFGEPQPSLAIPNPSRHLPVKGEIAPGLLNQSVYPSASQFLSPHLITYQRWAAFPEGVPGPQYQAQTSRMRPLSASSSYLAEGLVQPRDRIKRIQESAISPCQNRQGIAITETSPVTSMTSNQDNLVDLQQAGSNNVISTNMLQNRNDLPSQEPLDHLMEKIQLLEAENKSFRQLRGHSLRIETLYTILERLGAAGTTFLDEPTWIIGPRGQAMLKAHYPIPDTNGYLSQQHDVAFVVMKFYESDEQREDAADAHRDKRALPRPQPTSESIRLESPELVEAVEAFFAQQSEFANDFPNFNIKYPITAPYLFWYHYGSSTALECLSAPHADTMTVLTSWIDDHYGDVYNSVRYQLRKGVTTAETMEFLFKPGEVLVWGEENDMVAAIESSWPTIMFKPSSKSISQDSTWKKGKDSITSNDAIKWKWQVNTWQYHYDGSFQHKIRKATIVLQASSYTEEVPIVKVTPYPLKYASDKIRYKLQLRGETFWKCRFRRLVSCKDEKGLVVNGERFMIDFETYEQLHSDSANFKDIYRKLEDKKSDPMDPEVMASDIPPCAPDIYVFPPKITGYNLRSKKWDDLAVDLIQDVVWNKKSFEHLVIDFETKELVQALVTNQIESEQSTDIIEQKGNGLIILLHGGPGTGKTFTAESVAEMAEKPLFRVTCGDIGTKPEVVEKYLESVLYLGKSWGCVVLLDEADVFLEQRTLTDLERNALVSVFLRVLEYYEGILILTSNRVGTFDEAFKSRIQLALHYQNLTEGQRRKIWKNFLNRLKGLDADSQASSSENSLNSTRTKSLDPLEIDFDDIECYLADLARYELNGRQIRNAITTARQLAKFKKEKMSFHHLEHVITVSGKFDTYLQKVQEGFTDDQVARGGGIR